MPLQPNVAGLVQSFNVGPLTLTRRTSPTQNEFGGYDDVTPSSVTLDPVAIHPVTGRDLDQVPEAHRNRETIRVYTTVRLYVGDGGQAADTVSYRGRTWRVVNTEDNELQGGVYLSLAVLEDP